MNDYISRQAVIDELEKWGDILPMATVRNLQANIYGIPPADVRHIGMNNTAKWIPHTYTRYDGEVCELYDEWYGPEFECSNCAFIMIGKENFCPNCGKKMTNVEE